MKTIKSFLVLVAFLPGLIIMLIDECLGLGFDIEKDIREIRPCLVLSLMMFWIWMINLIV